MTRIATIHRKTAETDIQLVFNLHGTGTAKVETGVGFLDVDVVRETRNV